MAVQLTLSGFTLQDHATFTNFYPGKNQLLYQFLESYAAGEGERFTYLWGNKSSGRSHLLQACCHHAHSQNLSAIYLPLAQLPMVSLEEVLEGLEHLSLVCLDDVDSVAGQKGWEEIIFHFYNRIRDSQNGGRLLVAGSALPKDLPFSLPDLASRLAWGVTFFLHPLTDEERLEALQLRASQRGFILPTEVGHFILRRCSRNMTDLFDLLAMLDQASLTNQRRLTIPFVKSVLGV